MMEDNKKPSRQDITFRRKASGVSKRESGGELGASIVTQAAERRKRIFSRAMYIVSALILGAAILAYFLSSPVTMDEGSLASIATDSETPSSIKVPLFDLLTDGQTVSSRIKALKLIGEQNNPYSSRILQRIIGGELGGDFQIPAQNLMLGKLKSNGKSMTAQAVGEWLASLDAKDVAKGKLIPVIFKLVDEHQLEEKKDPLIKLLETGDKAFTEKLFAALTLESKGESIFSERLKEMVRSKDSDIPDYVQCVAAIVLSVPENVSNASDLAVKKIVECSDQELLWLLSRMIEKKSSTSVIFAKELHTRDSMPPLMRPVLDMLVNEIPRGMPYECQGVLVKVLMGEVTAADLAILRGWLPPSVNRVLVSIVKQNPGDVGNKAFQLLVANRPAFLPCSPFIEHLRRNRTLDIMTLANDISTLCLLDLYSDDEIKSSIVKLSEFIEIGKLFDIAAATNEERIINTVVDKFSDNLASDKLISLLDHNNKHIRQQAVKGLARSNELATNQILKEKARMESDPEVMSEYRTTISLIDSLTKSDVK